MKANFTIILVAITTLLSSPACSKPPDLSPKASESAEHQIVRLPAVAGKFYPGDKDELEDTIDKFLLQARPSKSGGDGAPPLRGGGPEPRRMAGPRPPKSGEILALVVPHAGYAYSGQVAAYGYKELIGEDIDTVVLIGNSHREHFEGVSVFPKGRWMTPLGEVEVDADLAGRLINAHPRIFFKESAHTDEHSLEVQLPFLQKVIRDFKIVPILFGNAGGDDYQILAKAILENVKGKKILLVASSDLSHYPPYKAAKSADAKTVEGILSGDVKKFEGNIAALEEKRVPGAVTFACAEDAIKTVMLAAKGLGANEIKLLNAANSGDAAIGEKERVVGYAAVGFYGLKRENLFNKSEQKTLLDIAKKSVETFVKAGGSPKYKTDKPALKQKLGAFVTLKKHGVLRGCIGRFSPADIPLYEVVSKMAVAAASEDLRFDPVRPEELKDLTYEVSVLSIPEKIDSWKDVILGKHGVIVEKEMQRGVFLPQVAYNMTLEEFLGELCSQKAGLPRDCYLSPDVNLYIFTAQVFGDEQDHP